MLNQIGKLTGFYVSKNYPEKLRRIKFYDEETDMYFNEAGDPLRNPEEYDPYSEGYTPFGDE